MSMVFRSVPLRDTEEFTYELNGPGKIDSSGVYTAPEGKNPAAVTVTAKLGDVMGQARIRVVPPLPWKFDFNDITLKRRS